MLLPNVDLELLGFHMEDFGRIEEIKPFINETIVNILPDDTYLKLQEQYINEAFCSTTSFKNLIVEIAYNTSKEILEKDKNKQVRDSLFTTGVFFEYYKRIYDTKEDDVFGFVEQIEKYDNKWNDCILKNSVESIIQRALTFSLVCFIIYYPVFRLLNIEIAKRYAKKNNVPRKKFPEKEILEEIFEIAPTGFNYLVSDYYNCVKKFISKSLLGK